MGIFKYQYSQTDYQNNKDIQKAVIGTPRNPTSKSQNSHSHYVYTNTKHNFTPNLSNSAKLNAQHIDFFNDPTFKNKWSPYAQANVRYLYIIKSSIKVKIMHQQTTSDIVNPSGPQPITSTFVHDQQTTTAYGTIRHQIMPNLFSSLMGTYQ